MTDPLLLLVDALAVFRLSRLIVADSILDTPRAWLLRRWPGDDTEFYPTEIEKGDGAFWIAGTTRQAVAVGDVWVAASPTYLGKWLECVWCVSVWCAPAVISARLWWGWWQWPALVLAHSAVAGWIHSRTYQEGN